MALLSVFEHQSYMDLTGGIFTLLPAERRLLNISCVQPTITNYTLTGVMVVFVFCAL